MRNRLASLLHRWAYRIEGRIEGYTYASWPAKDLPKPTRRAFAEGGNGGRSSFTSGGQVRDMGPRPYVYGGGAVRSTLEAERRESRPKICLPPDVSGRLAEDLWASGWRLARGNPWARLLKKWRQLA